MAQTTKADRQAAARKGAVTRQRNQAKARSQVAGQKAAASRQRNEAVDSLQRARSVASSSLSGITKAARLAGDAAKWGAKSVASRLSPPKR